MIKEYRTFADKEIEKVINEEGGRRKKKGKGDTNKKRVECFIMERHASWIQQSKHHSLFLTFLLNTHFGVL